MRLQLVEEATDELFHASALLLDLGQAVAQRDPVLVFGRTGEGAEREVFLVQLQRAKLLCAGPCPSPEAPAEAGSAGKSCGINSSNVPIGTIARRPAIQAGAHHEFPRRGQRRDQHRKDGELVGLGGDPAEEMLGAVFRDQRDSACIPAQIVESGSVRHRPPGQNRTGDRAQRRVSRRPRPRSGRQASAPKLVRIRRGFAKRGDRQSEITTEVSSVPVIINAPMAMMSCIGDRSRPCFSAVGGSR